MKRIIFAALFAGVLAGPVGADEAMSVTQKTLGIPTGSYTLVKAKDDQELICGNAKLIWSRVGDDEALQLGGRILFGFNANKLQVESNESYGRTIRCTNHSVTTVEPGVVSRREEQVCDDGKSISRPVEVSRLERQGDRLFYRYSRQSNDQIKWPNMKLECEFAFKGE